MLIYIKCTDANLPVFIHRPKAYGVKYYTVLPNLVTVLWITQDRNGDGFHTYIPSIVFLFLILQNV